MAAVKALTAFRISRIRTSDMFAPTPPMIRRGRISLRPCRVCRVSRDVTMNAPTTTNNTKTALAVTRHVVQIALTCGLFVRSGVDRTVVPSVFMIGVRLASIIQAKKSLIALRIWPGMSYQDGSSSDVAGGVVGLAPGVGFGCGVPVGFG